jgi:multifunctional beta-oxidation protein
MILDIELTQNSDNDTTGGLFEVTGGWASQLRWQLAGGHGFSVKKALLPEDIIAKWGKITDFSTSAIYGVR